MHPCAFLTIHRKRLQHDRRQLDRFARRQLGQLLSPGGRVKPQRCAGLRGQLQLGHGSGFEGLHTQHQFYLLAALQRPLTRGSTVSVERTQHMVDDLEAEQIIEPDRQLTDASLALVGQLQFDLLRPCAGTVRLEAMLGDQHPPLLLDRDPRGQRQRADACLQAGRVPHGLLCSHAQHQPRRPFPAGGMKLGAQLDRLLHPQRHPHAAFEGFAARRGDGKRKQQLSFRIDRCRTDREWQHPLERRGGRQFRLGERRRAGDHPLRRIHPEQLDLPLVSRIRFHCGLDRDDGAIVPGVGRHRQPGLGHDPGLGERGQGANRDHHDPAPEQQAAQLHPGTTCRTLRHHRPPSGNQVSRPSRRGVLSPSAWPDTVTISPTSATASTRPAVLNLWKRL